MKELSLTTALRHRELRPDIERLRQWADEIGVVHIDTVRHRLGAANELLMTRLLPHALAEDEILYPAARKFVGAQAIEMLQRDHGEMLKLTAELNALRLAASANEVGPRFAVEAAALYGLGSSRNALRERRRIVLHGLEARCPLQDRDLSRRWSALRLGSTPRHRATPASCDAGRHSDREGCLYQVGTSLFSTSRTPSVDQAAFPAWRRSLWY